MSIEGRSDEDLPRAILLGMIVKDITVKYKLSSQTPIHSRETESDRQDRTLSKILFDTLGTIDEQTLRKIHEAIQGSRPNQKRPTTD